MTHSRIDRAVARATGESIATIRRMGFQIACPRLVRFDPEPDANQIAGEPAIVDWDDLDAQRVSYLPQRTCRVAA